MLVSESEASLVYIGRARVTQGEALKTKTIKPCFPLLLLKNYWQVIAALGREDSFLQECPIFIWREERRGKGGEGLEVGGNV